MRRFGTRALVALLAGAALALRRAAAARTAASAAAPATGTVEGAKAAPTLEEARDAKGNVTFCAGKDTSGGYAARVERFNERYADQGLEAELLEFPEGSDNQREQAVQRLEARSPECDVYQADIIWIAEFA